MMTALFPDSQAADILYQASSAAVTEATDIQFSEDSWDGFMERSITADQA